MSSFNAHHHIYAPKLPRLTALNSSQALGSLAEGLSSIFVPIFLYKSGYSLTQIALYLLGFAAVWLLAIAPTVWVITRRGPRTSLVLGLLFGAIQFVLLINLPKHPGLLPWVAVYGGFTAALYWLPFRYCFAEALKRHSAARNVGLAEAIITLTSGLAPAIGGFIATYAGISRLYAVSIALFLVAAIPLFTFRQAPLPTFAFRGLWQPERLRHYLANAMVNIDDAAAGTLWPLLIFVVIPSYVGVGLLVSITLLAAIGASLYAGTHARGNSPHRNTTFGSYLTAFGNVVRPLVQSGAHVFGTNIVAGFGKSLALTPYMVRYYHNVQDGGLGYAVGMQTASALGHLVLFGGVLVLSLLAPTNVALGLALLLAAPCILGAKRLP